MVSWLSARPPEGTPVPEFVAEIAAGDHVDPVWLNAKGGLTFQLGTDRYLKWSPGGSLAPERKRLQWASQHHPVPHVIEYGNTEGDWLVTEAIAAVSAVYLNPEAAARAHGVALRALHENLPLASCPFQRSLMVLDGGAPPPSVDRLVVCHGDACLPNTLVDSSGQWKAHVDLGDLGVADRWHDLAVAAWSVTANFGGGFDSIFYAAYGIEPDGERIDYYTARWNAPSA